MDIARELHAQWVGPMPVNEFLEEFMPVSEEVKSASPKAVIDNKSIFEDVKNAKGEIAKAKAMLALVNKHQNELLPGFKLVDTSNSPDVLGDQSYCIDVTCYDADVDTKGRANQLDNAEMGMEFKATDGLDPFNDSDDAEFEKDTPAAEEVQGQIALYATEWFNHQHRTHVFIVFISQSKARFFYFDRSGAVVSEIFDYGLNPKPLVDFMWFFAHLSKEQRGLDTTVSPATDAEETTLRVNLKEFHTRVAMTDVNDRVLGILKKKKELLIEQKKSTTSDNNPLKVDDALTDEDWDIIWAAEHHHIWGSLTGAQQQQVDEMVAQRMPSSSRKAVVISVPDGTSYRKVVAIGSPLSADSLVGRSTRAWPVWDLTTKKLCYLKDSWRSKKMGIEREILKELNRKAIPYVPHILCGNDLGNQSTRADTFYKRAWVRGKPRLASRIHHRFLVDFIGRPLKHFTSSKQMLQVTYDAFKAHRAAWEDCGILHRDISGNNVMLDRWGRGVLNDWDLAKKKSEMNKTPRTHARTGTWYFMSTLLLMTPGKQHNVQDDLESFLLLVLFHTLCYLKHNRTEDLGALISNIFESCSEYKGTIVGGQGKLTIFVNTRVFINDFELEDNPTLNWWIWTAFMMVREWIMAKLDAEGEQRSQLKLRESESSTDTPKIRRSILDESPPVDETTLKLYDHQNLDDIFREALEDTDWPEGCDKVVHEFPGREKGAYQRSSGTSSHKRKLKGSSYVSVKKMKASTSSGSIMPPVQEDTEDEDSE